MKSEQPQEPADYWSQSRLLQFSESEREQYELACDQGESALRAGTTIPEIVSALDCSLKVRILVLLDLAKCDIERVPARAAVDRAKAIILEFPQLLEDTAAKEELMDFATACNAALPVELGDTLPATHEFVSQLPSLGLAKLVVARRKRLNRLECIKLVKTSAISNPQLAAQIEEEAQRASKLSHPGLVQIFDAGEVDGHCYIAMEYMNGGSLADRLASGPIPWETAVRLIATAARALDALHTKGGLSHGDIKPANILFTRTADGEELVKIADFGLSSELLQQAQQADVENPRFVFGTPGYIAPELLSEDIRNSVHLPFDHRVTADVFSLGVTAYEVICGRLPFQNSEDVDPFAVLNGTFQPVTEVVSDVPKVVAYVLKRACAPDRRERFLTAKEFARALEQCLSRDEHGSRPECAKIEGESQVAPNSAGRGTERTTWKVYVVASIFVLAILVFLLSGRQSVTPDVVPLVDTVSDLRATIRGEDHLESVDDLSPDMARLTSKGMSPDVARSILSLNESWFSALRDSDETREQADRMMDMLSEIDESRFGSSNIVARPYCASIATYPGVENYNSFVDAIANGNQSTHTYLNLCIQHPHGASVSMQLPLWVRLNGPLGTLMQYGLYGADEALIFASGKPEYEAWVQQILGYQISQNPSRLQEWLAIFLDNHDSIRSRFTDEAFATSFPNAWERFVALNSENPEIASDFALNGDSWLVLGMDRGDKLIERFGIPIVPILVGSESLPNDSALRAISTDYLLVGYSPIVESFCDKHVRRSPDFHTIIRKHLPPEVFAHACSQINSQQESGRGLIVAADIARKSSDHLIADYTGEDINKWPAERLVPHLIYLRLGLKVVSGDSFYGPERQALFKRIALDVVAYGAPIAGERLHFSADQTDAFVQHFPVGYEIGENAVREVIRRERLQSLVAYDVQSGSLADLRKLQDEVHKDIREIVSSVTHQSGDTVLDVTNSMRLCEGLSVGDDNLGKRVDLRMVSFLRLTDGRLFPGVVTQDGIFSNRPVKQFFDDRWQTLASHEFDSIAKESAWQEIVSAWFLLGSCDLIPSSLSN